MIGSHGSGWFCRGAAALALATLLPLAAAQPAQPTGAASPASSAMAAMAPQPYPVAPSPPLPQATDSNAQREKSQPLNNAPMWRGVRDSGHTPGYSSLPALESGTLIQKFMQYPGSRFTTAGEAWRQVRNNWILPYGAALLIITLLALGLFYFAKGPLGKDVPDRGRLIERFTYFERAAHWTNAIAFSILAISGLVMAFGKYVLQPIIGGTLLGGLAFALKNLHNFVGPLFLVSLVIVFFTFLRSNWPTRADLQWLLKAGGMFGGKEVPSHRFNAGEKLIFWGGVVLLGAIVVVSGFVLDKVVPGLELTRSDMQLAHIVHSVASVLIIAAFLGHIYMGTIGMSGAYEAMKTGYVDEGWAHEHHQLWYDDIAAGKIPAQRTVVAPAGEQRPA
jgi:formate dehydrogenase subunit gamma